MGQTRAMLSLLMVISVGTLSAWGGERPAPANPKAAWLRKWFTSRKEPKTLAEQLANHRADFPGKTGLCIPYEPSVQQATADLLGQTDRMAAALSKQVDGATACWDDTLTVIGCNVMRFTEPAAARTYFGLALDIQRQLDEKAAKDGSYLGRLLDCRPSGLNWPGAQEVARLDKRYQARPGGVIATSSTVTALAGDMVFILEWQRVTADLDWAQAVFADVLAWRQRQP